MNIKFWVIILKTLINKLIKKGKKNIALKIIIQIICNLNIKFLSWKNIISNCILKIKPVLILRIILKRYRRILVPNITNFEKELKIATRWLVHCAKSRIDDEKQQFSEKLTNEILETLFNKKSDSRTLSKKKQFYDLVKTSNVNVPFYYKIKIIKRKKKW